MAPVVDVLKEMGDIVRLFRQQMDEENRKFLVKLEQLMKTAKMSGNPDDSAPSVHRGMTEQSDRVGSEEAQEILSSGNFMHPQPRIATVNAALSSMTPAIPQNDEVLPIIKSLRMSSFNYQPKGIQELHPSSVNGGSDCRQNVSVPLCLPMYLQGEAVSRFDWYVLERTHINLDDFIGDVCARFREDKAAQLEVVITPGALKVFDKSPKRGPNLVYSKICVFSKIGEELLFVSFDPGGLEAVVWRAAIPVVSKRVVVSKLVTIEASCGLLFVENHGWQWAKLAFLETSCGFLFVENHGRQWAKLAFIEAVNVVFDPGGGKALVDLIFKWSTGGDGVLERTTGALANLAVDDKCSIEVALAGSVHVLLMLAQNCKFAGVQERAAGALWMHPSMNFLPASCSLGEDGMISLIMEPEELLLGLSLVT